MPLREQPAYSAKLGEIAVAEGVRARAREREDRARARQLNPAPSRGAVDRMRDLAAGGFIPAAAPADERQAAQHEAWIARAAEVVLHGELDEIARELSYQCSLRLVAENRAAMLELYGHLSGAAAALAALWGLHARIIAQGYQPSSVVMPTFVPAAAYQIGAPDDYNSQVSALRRWLADQGMI